MDGVLEAIILTFRVFTETKLPISLLELVLFVVLNSGCILLGRHKLGLLVSYLFVLYWGFVTNHKAMYDLMGTMSWGIEAYFFFGGVMLILAIIGFFFDPRE